MTPTQMTLAVLFPVLLTIGVPIYVSLGLTGFAVAYFTDSPMQFASQTILNGVNICGKLSLQTPRIKKVD